MTTDKLESKKIFSPEFKSHQELHRFLDATLDNFQKEIELVLNRFSFQSNGAEHVFFRICSEMTWIGLWANAIRRGYPDSGILSEFTLYSNDLYLGRPDLLVTLENSSTVKNILFEAKAGEWKNGWLEKDSMMENYYLTHHKQARYYTDNFGATFSNLENSVNVVIGFEWFRGAEAVKKSRETLKLLQNQNSKYSHFISLYTLGDHSGVWMFGNISGISNQT